MKTFFSPATLDHNPLSELNRGALVPPYECKERALSAQRAVALAGLGPVLAPNPFADRHVERIHDPAFLQFLAEAWARWRDMGRDGDAIPMCWRGEGMKPDRPPAQLDAQLGFYCFDVMTPIAEGSWRAARASVDTALGAAALLASGAERSAFALCRPPGHHAGIRTYGGYCFLNSAAVAAQFLRDEGASRIAIFDPDYHHGNGTQEIFYERDDVLYVSIHADPASDFPFYSGFAQENGTGVGEGYNLNLPLPRGAGWTEWLPALDAALLRVRWHRPDAIVVSLGVDVFDGDPLSQFRFTADDFGRLGHAIAALGLPTLFVLEGGYDVDKIGDNVVRTLRGFLGD
jgi:acetoin utilization deacetylase AcuC-like enzyme